MGGQATPSALLNRAPLPADTQQLTGTGSQSSTQLEGGRQYTIKNSQDALVWIKFGNGSAPTVVAAEADAWPLGPYERFDWYVTSDTEYVGAIGAASIELRIAPTGP